MASRRKRRSKRQQKLAFLAAVFAVTLVLGTGVLPFGNPQAALWKLDSYFFDLFANLNLKKNFNASASTIVAFDIPSLHQAGYPVSRSFYASALKGVNRANPAGVAIDIIFGESRDLVGTEALEKSLSSSAPVVLAATRSEDGTLDGPSQNIVERAHEIGLTDSYLDADGKLRWYPLIHRIGSSWLPSLALAAWSVKSHGSWSVDTDGPKIKSLTLKTANKMRTIDLTGDPAAAGRILLRPYSRSEGVASFSIFDFTQDTVLPIDAFKDRIAFIGYAVDGLRMHQPTAADADQVPLHSHAFILEDLTRGSWTIKSKAGFWLQLVLGFAAFGVCILAPYRFANGWMMTAVFILSSADIVVCSLLFKSSVFISPVTFLCSMIFAAISVGIRKLNRSRNSRAQLQKAFGRYLHPKLVAQLADPEQSIDMKGQEREIVVLFMDLRGFTSLSEQLDPHQLVELMNDYFGMAADVIQTHEGTVDKFIGDAVMAFWNAPVFIEDPVSKSYSAVIEIQKRFKELNDIWKVRYSLKSSASVGAGLHSGPAIVGNVGGSGRFNYTAMGDSVNTASRIEGLCKLYSLDILMSETVAPDANTEIMQIDSVFLKGKKTPTQIFAPVPWSGEARSSWQMGFDAYQRGDFRQAETKFKSAEKLGILAAAVFLDRIAEMKTPPLGWNGVWKLESK